MRRFLKRLRLPAGTRYAVLATELRPQPDPKTGRLPTEAELGACQRVIPLMNEALQSRGLVNIAEDKICVTGIKGPLEDGWQVKVAAFAAHPRPRRRRLTTGRHAPDVEAWISGWIANQQAAVRWFADRVHDADPRISEAIKWRRLTFTVAG